MRSPDSSPGPLLEYLAWPPGTGKTAACIELFREQILRSRGGIDSRAFFVLPSREHAERIQHLVLKKGIDGLFNAHILTINDLADHLLGSSAGQPPNDTVRRALLSELLDPASAEPMTLEYFAPVRDIRGFRELLADAIGEFKASRIGVEDFERAAQGLLRDPVFRMKFRDFTMLMKRYDRRLRELGYADSEDNLQRLSREGPRKPVDLILFDGFYHFNRAQQGLIESAARWCPRVVVTLTMDREGPERTGLFDYPERTRRFLERTGFRPLGCPDPSSKRTADPAISHLVSSLFAADPRPLGARTRSVETLAAQDPRAEIEAVGRRILRLRREQAAHFSDCCLILRDIAPYRSTIESVFERLGIPVAVHERRRLSQSGPARLLRRILKLALEDWQREDVLAVLRSSCLRERPDLRTAALIESAALAAGIRTGRQAWESLASSKELPAEGSKAILDLLERVGGMMGAADTTAFGRRLLAAVSVDRSDPDETRAIQAVEAALESCRRSRVLSAEESVDHARTAEALAEALDSGLYSARPAGKNRVQVYDAVMAMPKEYRAVFLCGLNEKIFPRPPAEDPLFKDDERVRLEEAGLALEPRSLRNSGERYFFWMAAARAKERLVISYARTDASGSGRLPSSFVEEVTRCLPGLPETEPEPDPDAREDWLAASDALGAYARLAATRRAPAPPPLPGFAKAAEWAVRRTGGELSDPDSFQALAAVTGSLSATRLEAFAVCPFKHFAGKVLRLAEAGDGRRQMAMGTFLHEALERCLGSMTEEERRAGEIWEDAEALGERMVQTLESLEDENPFRHEPPSRRRILQTRMRRALTDFARVETRLRQGRTFVPTHFEWNFGGASGRPLDLSVPGGPPIRLQGTIDRIDIDPVDGRSFVIDYKLSKRSPSLSKKWEMGLELQLPMYLLAAERLLGAKPVGAELRVLKRRSPKESAREGFYRSSEASRLGIQVRKNSKQVLGDAAFDSLLAEAERRIRAHAEAIRAGEITVRSKSCEHCAYDAVCRFDKWRIVYADEGA